MIEREFIFLLGYTGLMYFLVWLTFKFVAYVRINDDEFGAGALGTLLITFWVFYLLFSLYHSGEYLPTTLWMDWFESRGMLYSSGIFSK
jgi:hypothetical protein